MFKRVTMLFALYLGTCLAIYDTSFSGIGFQLQKAFAFNQSITNSQQSSDQSQTVTNSSGSTNKQIAIDNPCHTVLGRYFNSIPINI